MAAPAIGLRPNWTPRMFAQVNRSHPLAQSLAQCVISGRSIYGAPTVNTFIPTSGQYGVGVANNGTATQIELQRYALPPGPFTHMAAVTVTASTTGAAIAVCRTGTAGQTDRAIGVVSGPSWAIYTYDSTGRTGTGPAVVAGRAVVIGTSSGTSIQCWANGVPGTATATTAAGFAYSGETNWIVGLIQNPSGGIAATSFTGTIHLAATWNKVLTTSEIQTLSADPYCFLRY